MAPMVHVTTTADMLDTTYEAFDRGEVLSAMGSLRTSLRDLRQRLLPNEWGTICEQARRHPLHQLLLESPFTRRAFDKPRGYAGDAVMMDQIYGIAPYGGDVTALGRLLFGYEFDSPCFQSVRVRRAILACEIDTVAARRPDARVLSVASGHLREVEWSRAVRSGRLTITALDQDRDSLDLIDREYGGAVATVQGTVGDLLRRSNRFTDLDLVYAAGLYDYLNADVARALTAALFRLLRPGGRLLFANFTTETHDAAFMDAFMDWHLVYRTPDEIRSLASAIPVEQIEALDQFSDPNGHVSYLRVTRRSGV